MKHKYTQKLVFAGLIALLSNIANAENREERRVDERRADNTDWPLYSFDFNNSNFNPHERIIGGRNIRNLRRAWETFNDDTNVDEAIPTGFVLESVLGLRFRSPVVGVVSPPVIEDDVIYYVDTLGTVFARDARTGYELSSNMHWTTTLVDPDFEQAETPILPELIYTAPMLTEDHIWVIGSAYGRLHAVERNGGAEVDFDPSTPEIDPFTFAEDAPFSFSSVLGDSVIVEHKGKPVLVVSVNVILNDALVQGAETGVQLAYDLSSPESPTELWRTFTVPTNPQTGFPFNSGVSAGAGLAWDPNRGHIYGGTGQNTSIPYQGYPDPDLAPAGYIDRSDSLYAIDIETGEFVWSNQFHSGDVFDLNNPVSTGPNQPDGPRDADVLSPPILFSAKINGRRKQLAGNGSKGGLYRVVDRDTGETVWERQIANATGIGGIQAGAAVANGVVYVAGFEGIDDGFSDAQFGFSFDSGNFGNAFFATFSPLFWADVEDVSNDNDPSTGMRIKVYALDAATGESLWKFDDVRDFADLRSGAALRHVTVANGLVYVTSSSGELIVLRARNGREAYRDQTLDLNEFFKLGLGKPHHASMNAGSIVSGGMVYVPYGAQNEPSGGMIAYELNYKPRARRDNVTIRSSKTKTIRPLSNDRDPNGDQLRFRRVAGVRINTDDQKPDNIRTISFDLLVFNPGDDPRNPDDAYIQMTPRQGRAARELQRIPYVVEDVAPNRVVNGVELNESNFTHKPLRSRSSIYVRSTLSR